MTNLMPPKTNELVEVLIDRTLSTLNETGPKRVHEKQNGDPSIKKKEGAK